MGINLGGLNSIANKITSLTGLALVTPKVEGYSIQNMNHKPVTLENPFLFHYEEDNTVTLTSDVTDHVVEDNTIVNDQVSLRPEVITVRGFIGEVNNVVPKNLEALRIAKDKLTTVGAFVPALSATALRAFNIAEQGYQTALINKNNIDQLRGKKIQNKQQDFFQSFYKAWKARRLFTVQTPWATFDDMIIQTMRALQDKDSELVSDFELTFKKIRFAKTKIKLKQSAGRAKNQSAPKVNNGLQTGQVLA